MKLLYVKAYGAPLSDGYVKYIISHYCYYDSILNDFFRAITEVRVAGEVYHRSEDRLRRRTVQMRQRCRHLLQEKQKHIRSKLYRLPQAHNLLELRGLGHAFGDRTYHSQKTFCLIFCISSSLCRTGFGNKILQLYTLFYTLTILINL